MESAQEHLEILEQIVNAQLTRYISTDDKHLRKEEERHLYRVRNMYKELRAQIAYDPEKPYRRAA